MDLSITSTINDQFVFDCLDEHTKSVMKWAFSLVENMLTRTAQHNGASFITFATRESDNFILTNEDLLDWIASTQNLLWTFRIVESWEDLSSQSCWNALNAFKISVLNN